MPVLLIHGTEDPLVPIAAAREATLRLPNGRLIAIEDTGHWPQRELPEVFVRESIAFLSSHAGDDQ